MRQGLFHKVDAEIEENNAKSRESGDPDALILGHNPFSTMTDKEKKDWMGFDGENYNGQLRKLPWGKGGKGRLLSSATGQVDWHASGHMTPVKNQGGCGSCWAFAATAGMESVKAINDGELVGLSEQELVDCSNEEDGNYGCNGGWPKNAITKYVKKKHGGICSDLDYPYTGGETGSCLADSCTVVPGTLFSGCRYVYSPHEPAERNAQGVMDALATSPVIVAVSAAPYSDWLSYAGGIFDNADCGLEIETPVDHAMLLTGYGEDADGNMFWEFKNSWGDSWGDAGYIKFDRDPALAYHDGRCGMLRYIMQPYF